MKIYDQLISVIKQADEFVVFRQFLESAAAANPNAIATLHNNLSSHHQVSFRNLLKTKRIKFTQDDGTEHTLPRRLLKIKRKTPQ